MPEYEVNRLEINFMHEFVPTFYQDAVEISIGFSYETIYRLHDIGLLEEIRRDLFTICHSIGATEVFFVADVDKLQTIQEYLAMGWSYQQLKDEAIKMLGEPVRDYTKLNYDTLDYQNITEFMLDDFAGLKPKMNTSFGEFEVHQPKSNEVVEIHFNDGIHYVHLSKYFDTDDVEKLISQFRKTLSLQHFRDADDYEFIYCLVGNVVDKHLAEPSLGVKRGTKQFGPGTKVYCFPARWGGYEQIYVLGNPRKKRGLIKVVMKSKFIKNWRFEKVYDPTVICEMINDWGWTDDEMDKITIEEMLEWLPDITVEELPEEE